MVEDVLAVDVHHKEVHSLGQEELDDLDVSEGGSQVSGKHSSVFWDDAAQ